MNFFDYELSRNATATPPQSSSDANTSTEPTLNEEVNQVVGQLGKLWGGFRKQSQVALETARKDFSSVVAQAQKEIGKLTTEAETTPRASAEASASSEEAGPSTSEKAALPASLSGEEGPTPQPSSPITDHSSSSSSSQFQFQSLLSRVQSSLPPNISATLERTIPAALKDPSSHAYADLTQLRSTLGAEFARVQGVTRAQAEEYAHRSEALLREAGAYLKDAVRVIPPEEGEQGIGEADVVFDGMGVGVVVMPPSISSNGPAVGRDMMRAKGKGRETAAQAQQRLAGSRAAAMLAELKREPEIFKQDPADNENTKNMYEAWLSTEIASKEGGIESSYWIERVKSALGHAEDGEVLRSTKNSLVPSFMDSKTFWTRYFFKIHQIEKDEEKRKALLAASGDEANDEDFSWEDDDDESTTPSEFIEHNKDAPPAPNTAAGSLENARSSCDTLQPGGNVAGLASYPESLVTSPSPSNTSPRESSDGYDVVSPGSVADIKAKTIAEGKETAGGNAKSDVKDEDEGDSDWE